VHLPAQCDGRGRRRIGDRDRNACVGHWTFGETTNEATPTTPTTPRPSPAREAAALHHPHSTTGKRKPPRGYKYNRRSSKKRTCTWPITATTNWTVTGQCNTGVTGGTTLNATSNDQFDIGEYRTVLVKGAGG